MINITIGSPIIPIRTTLPLLKWLSMANNNNIISFPLNIKGILKPSRQLGEDFRLNNPGTKIKAKSL